MFKVVLLVEYVRYAPATIVRDTVNSVVTPIKGTEPIQYPGWRMASCYNASMNDLKILYPADVDWEAYRALRLEALREEPQAFGASYEENLQRPDSYWQGRLAEAVEGRTNWMLFACQQDRLVGMVGAYQSEAMLSQNIAFVVAVYVTASARGQGISRHLMLQLLDLLKQTTPICRVRLTVNVVQTAAVRLYQRLGFETLCSENGRLGDGRYYDEYIMERDLG